MMNNYFHDVATGLLLASAAALWLIIRRFEGSGGSREATEYFLRVYKGMTSFARFSLAWILIGGVPRTLFYKQFEWNTAVEHGQVPAIIIKHIMVFALLGLGVYYWRKFNNRVKEIRKTLESGDV